MVATPSSECRKSHCCFSERHQASIIEFENFSSVRANRRRRTPVSINSSTLAFTFSTPASANTTRALTAHVAPTTGLEQHGHAVARCKRVGHAPRQNASREVVDHGVHIGACPVEQADDGGATCHISPGPVVRSPSFGFAGCTRSRLGHGVGVAVDVAAPSC
jgi:hypothetical protein